MLYPVAIDRGESSFGVRVPDIPGCFSGGDNYQDALDNVREAIEAHIELLVEDGEQLPAALNVESYIDDPDYADVVWALVDVDVTRLMGKSEKINVTLPALLIRRIDQYVVANPECGSRSGFLAKAAMDQFVGKRKARV
ncbi:type II toxin-antitoxin system HicB family antitoxin [Erwinia aphidicola]|uniref:type II toxin-antitoxin system HicB family antitoxin n=1 Tax=Erwinia aphidicola TaxID=68334 RepID=UPI003D1D3B24